MIQRISRNYFSTIFGGPLVSADWLHTNLDQVKVTDNIFKLFIIGNRWIMVYAKS